MTFSRHLTFMKQALTSTKIMYFFNLSSLKTVKFHQAYSVNLFFNALETGFNLDNDPSSKPHLYGNKSWKTVLPPLSVSCFADL